MPRYRSGAVASVAALAALSLPSLVNAEDRSGESWRLFVADHTQPVVRSIDLATGKEIGRFDLSGYAGLSLSETGRTVFAIQGDENIVHAIDTGISLSDHGEHRDIEVKEPKLLSTVIKGQKPGHVVAHGDLVTVFYDREKKFDLLKESVLLDEKAELKAFDTIAAHHGVAVPMGSHLLVSAPDMQVPVKAGELPPRLGLRVLSGEGQQVGNVAACTGLHGEASSARLVAFGCEEGVIVARPAGMDGPKVTMLPYDTSLPKGRVSTLLGGTSLQFFLGNYGEDKVVVIDPEHAASPYHLVDLPTRRIDFVLDPAEPGNAYILTEDGKLHLLDVMKGEIVKTETVTEPYSKDGHWRDPRPRLAVAGKTIAVTDPRKSLVRLVSTETLKETRTIPVEGKPFVVVAAGGSGVTH